MFAFSTTQAIAGRQTGSRRPAGTGTLRAAPSIDTISAELIIDSKGSIIKCSDALLALLASGGITREQMTGKTVRSLIPGLPFQAATEGYNIAYATFAAAQEQASTWTVVLGDGRRVEAAGRIALQRGCDGYVIRLTLAAELPRTHGPEFAGIAVPAMPHASSRARLRQTGVFPLHARHANGHVVPARTSFVEGRPHRVTVPT